ncbi:ParA family protein [Leuconostoc gelidum]|uniref:Sporulation initiation inhibitor protein Soj n=1 Tax=Leuconostoc gelidum subsp. gelidum TaxID=1607839 RepID=A0AB35FXS4_LEUGE|nr:AAA family ATPase [Leuconostoc gelidum]AFS40997.1 chromosome partitioning protein ParA [Leuconostoc gelidum JB7]MBZ5964222.1 ParA family protein [Leuconostoc gelidum subsp. gelidum]MBZ5975737.1 ParA family protein [Leuconostoc gelidum subsp. gelidum]MBZ5976784.1 ParA family protein [Leuconostoc gelidum subsp. gelidum]MBZ5986048.1 ParA family protein [Leuconostoc gelidum subsp. gelidum]
MAQIIALANQKGGVGKTTTSVNLGAALAQAGKRVLLVDIDAQGNATSGSGVDKSELERDSYDVMVDRVPIREVIVPTDNYDLVPATIQLSGAEIELASQEKREYRLKKALSEVNDDYDFILIDNPPALGLLTVNAFTASDAILIPVQTEFYALEGLGQLLNTIELVRQQFNADLDISGILLTMYDGRTNLAKQVSEEVRNYFGDKVYTTVIPRSVRLSEAPSYGQAIIDFDPRSIGSKVYSELAQEVLKQYGN